MRPVLGRILDPLAARSDSRCGQCRGAFVVRADPASIRLLDGSGRCVWQCVDPAAVGGIQRWQADRTLKAEIGEERFALLKEYRKQSGAAGLTAETLLSNFADDVSIDDVRSMIDSQLALTSDTPLDRQEALAGRILRATELGGERISDGDLQKTIDWLYKEGT